MAIQDMDNKRRYTQYKRHVNESHERINADTVNTIQKDIQYAQEDRHIIKDQAFQERIYTIFNNNLFVNAMFIDPVENGNYINMLHSSNIKLDGELYRVSLDKKDTPGIMLGRSIHSAYGEEIGLNDFFLITNEYVPTGSSIKYYLVMHNGEKHEITPNVLKTPLHLAESIRYGFTLEADIKPNALNESPVINDYAVLYWDEQVEKNLGLINPDLQRFP